MRAKALAVTALALLLGCESAPPLPKSEIARQHVLGERILSALRHSKSATPEAKSDLALALSELVLPAQAPRLRLTVAGDNPTLAKGAAIALARITHRRDGVAGLTDCAKHDTNPFVRAACAGELATPPSLGRTGSVTRIKDAQVGELASSSDAAKRREAIRAVLFDPTLDRPGDARLQRALVHALSDADPDVALLASAVFLRRSLAIHPPPVDAAVPDVRTP